MRDIATTTLSGNLTRDIELRQLPSGADVARLRIATTTRRRHGEDWVDKTNYFTVEVYGAQARACAQYLTKGSRVFVDAEPDWREWTDQQNNKREAVTFKARQVLFEGARPDRTADDNSPSEAAPTAAPAPVAVSQPPAGAPPAAETAAARPGRQAPMTCHSDDRRPASPRGQSSRPGPRATTRERRRQRPTSGADRGGREAAPGRGQPDAVQPRDRRRARRLSRRGRPARVERRAA